MFLLEDRPETTRPMLRRPTVGTISDSTASPKSCEDQLKDFFQRLLRDGLYDAIWYPVSQCHPDVVVREPDPKMGFTAFVKSTVDRIVQVREARQQHGVSAVELGRMLAERDDVVDVVTGLSSTDSGRLAVDLDVIRRRRQTVSDLRELVLDAATTEAQIQKWPGHTAVIVQFQMHDITARLRRRTVIRG